MAYTHNFEIKTDTTVVEGEIQFDHGMSPQFRTFSGEELTLEQHQKVQDILTMFTKCACSWDEIEKIELTKKTT